MVRCCKRKLPAALPNLMNDFPRQEDSSCSEAIFALPDLPVAVLRHLDTADVRSAAAVSSTFAQASSSDTIWQPLCKWRWSSKWGFDARWAAAVGEPREGKHWRACYLREEVDAKRELIRPEELHQLRFDFRFRLELQKSASMSFRFGPLQLRHNGTSMLQGNMYPKYRITVHVAV